MGVMGKREEGGVKRTELRWHRVAPSTHVGVSSSHRRIARQLTKLKRTSRKWRSAKLNKRSSRRFRRSQAFSSVPRRHRRPFLSVAEGS